MLNYLFFKDINLECRDIKTILKNDTSKNTDIDHIVNNGGCDKTCETIIGIALVLVGQVYKDYLILPTSKSFSSSCHSCISTERNVWKNMKSTH